MSILESIFEIVLVVFRFFIVQIAIIAPVFYIVAMIVFFVKHKAKKSMLCLLCHFLSLVFAFVVFSSVKVSANINIESIENNMDTLLSTSDGFYEFETGYIQGMVSIGNESYTELDDDFEKHIINDDTVVYVSSLHCNKDYRLSHLFQPESSNGIVLIKSEDKIIEVDYWYNDKNIASIIWPVTNPEIIYRREVDFADIIETMQIDDGIDEIY